MLFVNTWTIIVIAIIIAICLVFVVIWSVRAHHRKVSAGKEDMVGRTAVADIALEPKGVVLVEGETHYVYRDRDHSRWRKGDSGFAG